MKTPQNGSASDISGYQSRLSTSYMYLRKMTYNSHSEIEIALTKFERGLVKVVGKPVANWGIKHGIKTSYDKTTPQGYAMYNFVNSILKKKEKRNLKIHVANLVPINHSMKNLKIQTFIKIIF